MMDLRNNLFHLFGCILFFNVNLNAPELANIPDEYARTIQAPRSLEFWERLSLKSKEFNKSSIRVSYPVQVRMNVEWNSSE